MPELVKVILLGIVEGLTEFLPISSTGHLIVAATLLNFGGALGGTFEIFIQFGSVVAVVLYYRADLWRQVTTVRHDRTVQRLWINLLVAFLPIGAVGFLLGDEIKQLLFRPATVAVALILGGIVFLVVERRGTASRATAHSLADISPRQAALIGLAQVTGLVPGVSRSGASIVGGMLAGLDRSSATHFSFYLAIPTLGLATVFDLVRNLNHVSSSDLVNLLVGALISGIVAWLAIGWLLRYVSRHDFTAFGYYRIGAGLIILILIAAAVF